MIRQGVFVDTSAWVACFAPRDQHHAAALSIWRQLASAQRRLVTSDYVVDETLTLMRLRAGHEAAERAGDALFSTALVQLIYVGEEGVHEGWALFKQLSRPGVSFTDATSFAIMRHLGLREVFGFDADFRSAGFTLL